MALICPSCGHVLREHKPEDAKRRTLKRVCTAHKVAVETADQADERRKLNIVLLERALLKLLTRLMNVESLTDTLLPEREL